MAAPGYTRERTESIIPLLYIVDEGTWNFSPTKDTQTGVDFISQKGMGTFERGNIAVYYMANSHIYYCRLPTQSYVHKSSQLILHILTL